MKSLNVRKFLLILIFATAIGFTACGGDDSGGDGDGTTPITPPPVAGLYDKASPTGNDTPIDVSGETGANDFAKAITRVKKSGAEYDGVYTLVIDADVSAAPQTLNVSNRQLTIIGIGGEREIKLSTNGALFIVGVSSGTNSTISLTLGNNITLVGRNATDDGVDNTSTVVSVQNGAKFIMLAGSKITDNTISTNGGGVNISTGSTFNMEGGEISGNNVTGTNWGGGVYVSGTFTMRGGIISGNSSRAGGGVCVSGTFTMRGGIISGNSSTSGGGVCVSSAGSTFTMEGGEISGNSASVEGGGVYVANASAFFNMVSGTIYGNTEAVTTLRNTAAGGSTGGAALYKGAAGTAQYGDGGGTWTDLPLTASGTNGFTNNTLKYLNGVVVP